MKLRNKWLYVIAFMLLVTPFAFRVSTAWAVYLSDGASQNGNTGGWNLPADKGQCVTGIAADGTMTIDETIKSRPDCIARTWPAYSTQAACGSTSGHDSAFLGQHLCCQRWHTHLIERFGQDCRDVQSGSNSSRKNIRHMGACLYIFLAVYGKRFKG